MKYLLSILIICLLLPSYALEYGSYKIVQRKGKKGIINDKGQEVIPMLYDDIGWSKPAMRVFVGNCTGYLQDGKWGLLHKNNSIILPPRYNKLIPINDEFVLATQAHPSSKKEIFGVINTQGGVTTPFKYHYIDATKEFLIAHLQNNFSHKAGIIDFKNNVLLPLTYANIINLSHGLVGVQDNSQKYALWAMESGFLTKFLFDSIGSFENSYAHVWENGTQGIINRAGKVKIDSSWKQVRIGENSQFEIKQFTDWQVITANNKTLFDLAFDDFMPIGKNLYKGKKAKLNFIIRLGENIRLSGPFDEISTFIDSTAWIVKNNKYELINTKGQVITKEPYDSIWSSDSYHFCMKRFGRDQAWSIYNSFGKKISKWYYQDVQKESEGLIPVKRKGHWGFIVSDGYEQIPCTYKSVMPFKDGTSLVGYLGSYGLIDTNNQWVLQPKQDYLEQLNASTFLFKNGNKHGLKNRNGQVLFESSWNKLAIENGAVVIFGYNNKRGLVNDLGNQLTTPKYDSVIRLGNSIYLVQLDGQNGLIKANGKTAHTLDSLLTLVMPEQEQYLGIKKDGKYGFVDTNGNLRVANRYEDIQPYAEQRAAIKIMGKWGFIDKYEEIIIQPRYGWVSSFSRGLARFRKGNKFGLLDKEGNELFSTRADSLEQLPTDRYKFIVDGMEGLIDKQGKQLIYPKYDQIKDLDNGYVIIKRNNKLGLISLEGIHTIPLAFDILEYDSINNVYLAGKHSNWEETAWME